MTLHKPSKEVYESFREELNEFDDEKIHENVKKMQDWISSQPHLPQNYDKRILPAYIRGCKHNLERVQRKLNVYFLLRLDVPELFSQRDPQQPSIQYLLSNYYIAMPLPFLTPDGSRITVFDVDKNIETFDVNAILKMVFMICDIRLIEEGPIRGDVFIFNTANFTTRQVTKLFVPLSKKVLLAAEEAYPQRLRQIHVVGTSGFIEKGINFYKMFVKAAIRNRFHVHSKYESLHQFIPTSYLPEEYGGELSSLSKYRAEWREKIESYGEYYQEQESIHIDKEKIRDSDRSAHNSELFGALGTFRKLTID